MASVPPNGRSAGRGEPGTQRRIPGEKRLELEARLREWEEKTEDFENSRIVREEKV